MSEQIASGLLGQLRTISPNVGVRAEGNEIIILIPKDDIVSQLLGKTDPRIRSSMSVEIVPEGLKIRARLL